MTRRPALFLSSTAIARLVKSSPTRILVMAIPPTFWVKVLLGSEAGWASNDVRRYYAWGDRLLRRLR